VARKKTLSESYAGAWGRIMAVRDENAISMVPDGKTWTVKSFPAAMMYRLSNSERPFCTD